MISRSLLNYQIERVIGEGGMGRVYLGNDTLTGQKVAIKELYAHLAANPSLRKRFEKEAQVLAALNHPGIVRLHRFIESEEGLFLIMEYIEGTPLDEHIRKVTGPVSEPKMIEIMSALLDAFQYAHDRGIIHRDIKPSNILFTNDHQVRVLDFGIAKITDDNDERTKLTKTGTRMGTVVFMSPEQVRGREVDARTDIYSLGILLHYMATGKPPYDDTTLSEFEINVKIVQEPLPRACEVYPFVSEKIQGIIDKATAKNISGRYANCNEFKADLLKDSTEPAKAPGEQKEVAATGIIPQPLPKKGNKAGAFVLAALVVAGLGAAYVFTKEDHSPSVTSTVETKTATVLPSRQDAKTDTTASSKTEINISEDVTAGLSETKKQKPSAAGSPDPDKQPATSEPEQSPAVRKAALLWNSANKTELQKGLPAAVDLYIKFNKSYPDNEHAAEAREKIDKVKYATKEAWDEMQKIDLENSQQQHQVISFRQSSTYYNKISRQYTTIKMYNADESFVALIRLGILSHNNLAKFYGKLDSELSSLLGYDISEIVEKNGWSKLPISQEDVDKINSFLQDHKKEIDDWSAAFNTVVSMDKRPGIF